MITSISYTSENVCHVVVAEGVHVRLCLVADHGVQVAQWPAQNWYAFCLTALVEGTVSDGRVTASHCGRLEDVSVRLSYTDHDHSGLIDVWVRVDHTPVDSRVL